MILKMVKEMNSALKQKHFMAAFIDALSIVDGMSKIIYPTENSQKRRYVDTWDNYIKINNGIDGKTAYDIRCCMMHESKLAIGSDTFDILALVIPSEYNSIGIDSNITLGDDTKIYRLDIINFCNCVANGFDRYYAVNKTIVDEYDNEIMVFDSKDMRFLTQKM